jgi:hypothetical protein
MHKLNTGSFTFLGFLSESEILHLGGIPGSWNEEKENGVGKEAVGNTHGSSIWTDWEVQYHTKGLIMSF